MDATHDTTALTLAVVSGFLLFAGGFWIIVAIGQWALAPVERHITQPRMPTQFSLREVALLAIVMQFVAVALVQTLGESPSTLTLSAVIGCSLLAAWWQGAHRLARCGVRCPWRRGLFLSVVIPLATASLMAALWHNGQAVMETCLGRHWSLTNWLAGNLAIIVAFVTCRLLTTWAMRDVISLRSRQVHDDGIQYVS